MSLYIPTFLRILCHQSILAVANLPSQSIWLSFYLEWIQLACLLNIRMKIERILCHFSTIKITNVSMKRSYKNIYIHLTLIASNKTGGQPYSDDSPLKVREYSLVKYFEIGPHVETLIQLRWQTLKKQMIISWFSVARGLSKSPVQYPTNFWNLPLQNCDKGLFCFSCE